MMDCGCGYWDVKAEVLVYTTRQASPCIPSLKSIRANTRDLLMSKASNQFPLFLTSSACLYLSAIFIFSFIFTCVIVTAFLISDILFQTICILSYVVSLPRF